ncbi:pickpocket protein 28-like [Phlebotomus argentipes]|uniref:pickpocket protein 28-like n=1 Tax=Phlebotomus argentipes TaxID=94469 RepID=UPI002892C799|nr:pickpocket protein 28-like [Phlebotomus argentipes]
MKLAEVFRKAYRMRLLMEYCKKSSVHGVIYWADRYRPYWERFLWIVLIVVSLVMSGRMISSSWIKWSKHAIAFTLGSHAIHISQIPFPAFTICSMARFQSARINYTSTMAEYQMKGHSPLNWDHFDDVSQICENGFSPDYFTKVTNSTKIYDTLRYYQQDPDSMFAHCNFITRNNSCRDYYQEIFTKHGRCYTFNALNFRQIYREPSVVPSQVHNSNTEMSNWTVSRGYASLNETYPLRVFQVMPLFGFTIRLKFNYSDADLICFPMGTGALIQLHGPAEVPFMSERYRAISLEQYSRVAVHPKMILTSPELERYSPHERRCFFPGEKYLQHFTIYNERNCRMECLTNRTLEHCGCVFFQMPRESKVLREQDNGIMKNKGVEDVSTCDCLPECTSINYKFDLIQHKMNLWQKNRSQLDEILIRIYFLQTTFIPLQRSELYGLTEFLASCGGILGLFMGLSVLSLTELFYFFPIRFLWDRYVAQRKIEAEANICVQKYVGPRF